MLDTYNQQVQNEVSCTIRTNINTANHHFIVEDIKEYKIGAMRGRNPNNPSERKKSNGNYKQRLEMNENGTSNTLTSVQKDNMVVESMMSRDFKEPKMTIDPDVHYRIRKLTPRECFRLMGVDDKDIDTIQGAGISNSQMYKLAGNSIVIDTLYHQFRKAFCETQNEDLQSTLF